MWQPPSREAPNKAQNNFLDFSGCLALMPAQMQEPSAATVTMLLGPALGWVMGCRHCVPCSCLSSAQGSDELSGHLFAVQHHASSVLFFPMRLIPLKILLLHSRFTLHDLIWSVLVGTGPGLWKPSTWFIKHDKTSVCNHYVSVDNSWLLKLCHLNPIKVLVNKEICVL